MPGSGVLIRPHMYCALSTPRISFGRPKSVICAVSGDQHARGAQVCGGVWRTLECLGGRTRGVLGGYYTGYYPPLPVPVYWYCQGPTIGSIALVLARGLLWGCGCLSGHPPHAPRPYALRNPPQNQ